MKREIVTVKRRAVGGPVRSSPPPAAPPVQPSVDTKSAAMVSTVASPAPAPTALSTDRGRKALVGDVLTAVLGVPELVVLIAAYMDHELCLVVPDGTALRCFDLTVAIDQAMQRQQQHHQPRTPPTAMPKASRATGGGASGQMRAPPPPPLPPPIEPIRLLPIRTIETGQPITCLKALATGPDRRGRRLLTAGVSTTVQVWDESTLAAVTASTLSLPEQTLFLKEPPARTDASAYVRPSTEFIFAPTDTATATVTATATTPTPIFDAIHEIVVLANPHEIVELCGATIIGLCRRSAKLITTLYVPPPPTRVTGGGDGSTQPFERTEKKTSFQRMSINITLAVTRDRNSK